MKFILCKTYDEVTEKAAELIANEVRENPSAVLGLASALGYSLWDSFTVLGMQVLDFFDFISNTIIMPIVAIITCIFIGFVIKPKAIIDEVECDGAKFRMKKLFVVMIKYVAPIFILLILVSSILNTFGIIKI